MTIFKPKKILCAVDLSPVSERILQWAGLFASTFDARVDVLYVDWWEPPRYFTEAQIHELTRQNQEGKKALREELERAAKRTLDGVATYNVSIVEGHPAQRILDRASELKAEMIVMGSHGRTGMARLRLGSVAEDVVRASLCPVLIVKTAEELEGRPSVENILCPVNFSGLSLQCLELSSEIANQFGARLWVVHATDHEDVKLEEVHERICEWVPPEVRGRCDVSEVVRRGDASEQILLMAREHSADIIVIGAQHRPLLEFTTLGTTTERVMRHSHVSVLVVPVKRTETQG
ncbi:MAG TPA: universal stress protein [Terriglobia bacterium]|nr:universal stress protein [Terriglobia bacterium]